MLTAFDSPGFNGDKTNDNNAAVGLMRIKPLLDVLLICFDLAGSGSRYMPFVHGGTMNKILEVFDADFLRSKSVIILTQGNKLSFDLQQEESQKRTLDFVREWAEKFWEQYPELADVPVEVAGQARFNDEGDMTHITDIDGSTGWLNSMWNTVATKAGGQNSGFPALMCTFCQRQLERVRQHTSRQQANSVEEGENEEVDENSWEEENEEEEEEENEEEEEEESDRGSQLTSPPAALWPTETRESRHTPRSHSSNSAAVPLPSTSHSHPFASSETSVPEQPMQSQLSHRCSNDLAPVSASPRVHSSDRTASSAPSSESREIAVEHRPSSEPSSSPIHTDRPAVEWTNIPLTDPASSSSQSYPSDLPEMRSAPRQRRAWQPSTRSTEPSDPLSLSGSASLRPSSSPSPRSSPDPDQPVAQHPTPNMGPAFGDHERPVNEDDIPRPTWRILQILKEFIEENITKEIIAAVVGAGEALEAAGRRLKENLVSFFTRR